MQTRIIARLCNRKSSQAAQDTCMVPKREHDCPESMLHVKHFLQLASWRVDTGLCSAVVTRDQRDTNQEQAAQI